MSARQEESVACEESLERPLVIEPGRTGAAALSVRAILDRASACLEAGSIVEAAGLVGDAARLLCIREVDEDLQGLIAGLIAQFTLEQRRLVARRGVSEYATTGWPDLATTHHAA